MAGKPSLTVPPSSVKSSDVRSETLLLVSKDSSQRSTARRLADPALLVSGVLPTFPPLRGEVAGVERHLQERDLAFLDVDPVGHGYGIGHRGVQVVPRQHVGTVDEHLP